MNILIVNNPYFIQELQALGHRVEHLGFGEESFQDPYQFCEIEKLFEKLPSDFNPELLIYVDNSRPVKVFGIERLKIPTIFYSIDAHIHVDWHVYMGAVFDYVFVAQKDYLERFRLHNPSCSWLPLWGPEVCDIPDSKSINVSFRGSLDQKVHPHRLDFFQKLSAITEVDFGSGSYINTYSNSRIVINELINNDLNFRVFEGMACGAMLMSPITSNGLTELFEPGLDFVTYEANNPEDAASKIKLYLNDDDARKKIAESGLAKVRAAHTLRHRIKQILDIAVNLNSSQNPDKHLASSILNLFFVKEFRLCNETAADLLLARSVNSICQYSNHNSIDDGKAADVLTAIAYFISYSSDAGLNNSFIHALRYILSSQPSSVKIATSVVRLMNSAGQASEARQIADSLSLDFNFLINQ